MNLLTPQDAILWAVFPSADPEASLVRYKYGENQPPLTPALQKTVQRLLTANQNGATEAIRRAIERDLSLIHNMSASQFMLHVHLRLEEALVTSEVVEQ